jgi:phospholipase D1/2
MVMCGNGTVKIKTKEYGKARDWVAVINDTGLQPLEGWFHPHCFVFFSPPRGLISNNSEVKWFIDRENCI